MNKIEYRNINYPYDNFPKVGAYFMLGIYAHQPVWCSYSLQQLKEIWDTTGGILTDSTGYVLFVKPQVKN